MSKQGAGVRSSAIVLLSGGLESSYNLLKAVEKFDVKLALTFDYGQLAATKEQMRSEALAKHFKVPHQMVWTPWFRRFTDSALLSGVGVPTGKEVELENLTRSEVTAKSVWVPNRNGIFLNIAAGFAEGLGAEYIIPGFNREEAQTFPDNSAAFLSALDESLSFSTATRVRTFCFSTEMTKTEIVADIKETKLPLEMLWPCYRDQSEWCGECESCLRFKRALHANGLDFEALRGGAHEN